MIKIAIKLFFSTIMFVLASQASAAGFKVFDSVEHCENAPAAFKAIAYKPTTVAPFKGGNDWEKKVVPAGGACLGGAYILEDGSNRNGVVFVAEGFVYWKKISTEAFRMHDCSNHFSSIKFIGKATTLATQPVATATPAPLPCTENCGDITKTQTITYVVKEVKVCEASNGTRFEPVNGVCIFPVTKAVVSMEVEAKATCTTCAAATTLKPTVQQVIPAGCTANCESRVGVTVQREEKAKVCGIAFYRSLTDKTIVARLQLDESPTNPGKMRIAKVVDFEGKAIQVASSSLSHNSNCDIDQATVYQNLPAIIKKFGLPIDCIPARGKTA